MIIIKFGGGLGNQLFQYAMLLSLKKIYPNKTFYCDINGYDFFNEHNGFEINKYFEFTEKYAELKDVKKVKPLMYLALKFGLHCKTLKSYNKYLKAEKVLSLLLKKNNGEIKKIEDKGTLIYNPSVFGILDNRNYYYDGGWQSIHYFDFDYLRSVIRFRTNLNEYEQSIYNNINQKLSVSIHVRRGDFITNSKTFDLCSKDYYTNAILKIQEKFSKQNEPIYYFIFSDDRQYIEENFNLPNMTIVRGTSSGTDLFLMSQCKANIIANSTFSFWGAALNSNNPIVIVPKYFVNIGSLYYKMDIPSDRWYTIDNIQ